MNAILHDAVHESAHDTAGTQTAFALEGVAFAAGGRTLLHPLDLTIEHARVTGLVGHNGSGKSTLVKLLARQLDPAAGTIRYAGRPLAQWSAREFARQVAYLPQQTPLTDGMTVRELVALGRYPWHGALGRFNDDDAARNLAARFCDRIVALREGRLLMRERAADIIDPLRLESIYGVPMSVSVDPSSGRRLGFPA
ncbi:ATP-binding cassette domain-containing protein [Paraburkholderia sp. SIMBA_027]|uniref:ATP-binding cassette domain-containing protein n=1 Tax=Paraburkholderia sp. SIMBA_027 TaxID=3085770 RepID=UPI003977EEB6